MWNQIGLIHDTVLTGKHSIRVGGVVLVSNSRLAEVDHLLYRETLCNQHHRSDLRHRSSQAMSRCLYSLDA